jgi:hypothetical protein
MDSNAKAGELTASIAESAIYTELFSQALFEILEEKGLVTRAELTARIEKLCNQTTAKITLPRSD